MAPVYRPDPRHTRLGDAFYDPVRPAEFPQAVLRFRNQRWADAAGLGGLSDADWVRHFARFEPLPDNLQEPLALRYHGHQFQSYNPDLGDGRGFLFAQLRDAGGRLLDLGTKGSGQTPWSRSGDGRLTLKGGMREVLATEMLEALGCNSSKSFSLIETGEALTRNDEPSPARSSVLVRLSHSHIRIGTFQRLAALDLQADLKRLVDYSIETYWPQAVDANDPVLAFYECVVRAVANMGAEWHGAGFVHGVLNTDNIVITGESFDYGPWRFLPTYDLDFVAAYFDHTGLYAFGRQHRALQWNLARFAECLLPLTPVEGLEAQLKAFPVYFDEALRAQISGRLGFKAAGGDLVQLFLNALKDTQLPFERVFFDLVGGAMPERVARSPYAKFYEVGPWPDVIARMRSAAPAEGLESAMALPFAQRDEPVTMLIDEVEALWSAIDERDDWVPFEAKIRDIREMGAFYERLMATNRH